PARGLAGPLPPPGRRERRDAALVAVGPMLLLALAGGRVLGHGAVEPFASDGPFVDPAFYDRSPPSFAERWSGALYPALRLRPLDRERPAAWLATLTVALVFLVLLGWLVYRLRWRPRPAGAGAVVALGWAATTVAAAVASVVDHLWLTALDGGSPPGTTLLEAVRFALLWGWLPGAALLAWERHRAGGSVAVSANARPVERARERADVD
ncbi:hypothetical protein EBN88_28940, partial [Streptomyces triticirhizae]